ncbi:hypothetical protein [Actinoplanes sp. CA-252034]|uniref:hypothetical protein n=1 Tax=Actinoplanes sp. CA-252034 TaxID=3239906 RepID=UPI003D95EB2A
MNDIDSPSGDGEQAAVRQVTPLSAENLLMVINGILVGVGGVFLTTSSLPVTAVAAASAVLLAVVILRSRR